MYMQASYFVWFVSNNFLASPWTLSVPSTSSLWKYLRKSLYGSKIDFLLNSWCTLSRISGWFILSLIEALSCSESPSESISIFRIWEIWSLPSLFMFFNHAVDPVPVLSSNPLLLILESFRSSSRFSRAYVSERLWSDWEKNTSLSAIEVSNKFLISWNWSLPNGYCTCSWLSLILNDLDVRFWTCNRLRGMIWNYSSKSSYPSRSPASPKFTTLQN